jgi:hypothetical protein
MQTIKIHFTVRGEISGWVRGPFQTFVKAEKEAEKLSYEKSERVLIEKVTITRLHETVGSWQSK